MWPLTPKMYVLLSRTLPLLPPVTFFSEIIEVEVYTNSVAIHLQPWGVWGRGGRLLAVKHPGRIYGCSLPSPLGCGSVARVLLRAAEGPSEGQKSQDLDNSALSSHQ